MSDRLINEDGTLNAVVYWEHIRQAKAKSIRVDRQAMAEWWMGEHAGDEYHEEGVRRNCPVCSDEYWLWVEARESKVPWEEKDAILETRKTPRTIPPD